MDYISFTFSLYKHLWYVFKLMKFKDALMIKVKPCSKDCQSTVNHKDFSMIGASKAAFKCKPQNFTLK